MRSSTGLANSASSCGSMICAARMKRCCWIVGYLCMWLPPAVVHDPATLLRAYAKRTDEADAKAANVIGSISKTIIGN